jgi:hypothetical protein
MDTSNNSSHTDKYDRNADAALQNMDYILVNTNIESIQTDLDLHTGQLSHEWKALIPFDCHVFLNELQNTTAFSFKPSQIDICDYLGGQKHPASRLVFCPIKYKPPYSNDKK